MLGPEIDVDTRYWNIEFSYYIENGSISSSHVPSSATEQTIQNISLLVQITVYFHPSTRFIIGATIFVIICISSILCPDFLDRDLIISKSSHFNPLPLEI